MAEKKWVMTRLAAETHRRLVAMRETLLRAQENGQVELELDHTGHVSLDQVVAILLDRDEQKKVRAAKSRARRQAGQKPKT